MCYFFLFCYFEYNNCIIYGSWLGGSSSCRSISIISLIRKLPKSRTGCKRLRFMTILTVLNIKINRRHPILQILQYSLSTRLNVVGVVSGGLFLFSIWVFFSNFVLVSMHSFVLGITSIKKSRDSKDIGVID